MTANDRDAVDQERSLDEPSRPSELGEPSHLSASGEPSRLREPGGFREPRHLRDVMDPDRSLRSPQDDPSWWSEFLEFVRTEKKWWLVPMVLSAIVITVLTTLSVAPVAPFIYTLF